MRRDVSGAAVEAEAVEGGLVDQRMVLAGRGKQLVYHPSALYVPIGQPM